MLRSLRRVLLLLGMVAAAAAQAIDNPDAADLLAGFERRAGVYLERIDQPNNTTRDYLRAYHDYQTFLDAELNQAYQILKGQLDEPGREALRRAQRDWIRFRDAEFAFIENNWTRESFGSSAGMSRGAYRCRLIRQRVEQLLAYAMNYPVGN